MISALTDHIDSPEYAVELVSAAQDKHGWSQRQLAEHIGVKRGALNNWMHRSSTPTKLPFSAQVMLEVLADRRTIGTLKVDTAKKQG